MIEKNKKERHYYESSRRQAEEREAEQVEEARAERRTLDAAVCLQSLCRRHLAKGRPAADLLQAQEDDRLAGCVFLAERADHFYLGKLAVDPALQGRGIGRLLMQEAEAIAVAAGKPAIELQTRIELTGNQAAFARMGFVETGRTAHAGFNRPTSITLRKALR